MQERSLPRSKVILNYRFTMADTNEKCGIPTPLNRIPIFSPFCEWSPRSAQNREYHYCYRRAVSCCGSTIPIIPCCYGATAFWRSSSGCERCRRGSFWNDKELTKGKSLFLISISIGSRERWESNWKSLLSCLLLYLITFSQFGVEFSVFPVPQPQFEDAFRWWQCRSRRLEAHFVSETRGESTSFSCVFETTYMVPSRHLLFLGVDNDVSHRRIVPSYLVDRKLIIRLLWMLTYYVWWDIMTSSRSKVSDTLAQMTF